MTIEKKTAEEIKTDIFFLYNKRPVEELVEYVMKLITPPPIQEAGEVTEKDFETAILRSYDHTGLNSLAASIKCFSLAQKICQAKDREIEELKKANDSMGDIALDLINEQETNHGYCQQILELQDEITKLKSSQVKEGELVYREVSCAEGNPSKSGWYQTNNNKIFFIKESDSWHERGSIMSKQLYPLYWLEPIVISQAKQGWYSEEEMRNGLEEAIIETSVNGNANYDTRFQWIDKYLQKHPALPQVQRDHIFDANKLVKTMSVELPSDEEMHTAIVAEFRSDCYGIAERAIELFRSKIKYLPAPLTIEEAKQKIARKYKFDSWNLLFNKRVGMPFELIEDDFNEVIKLYAQSKQPK